jgi:hypothetical protein
MERDFFGLGGRVLYLMAAPIWPMGCAGCGL